MLSLYRCRRVYSEGAIFFSFLAGMLSQHGCTSRAYNVTLSYQMLGMLGIHGYPAYVLLDRLIIFYIIYIIRYYSLLRDTSSTNSFLRDSRPSFLII